MLASSATKNGTTDPVLLGIAERAEAILDLFTERQTSTIQALDQLKVLMDERKTLEEERRRSGMTSGVFSTYWTLHRENISDAKQIANEIEEGFKRFSNFESNADELRQLKAELYKALLRSVSGKRMIDLAEQILKVRRAT